MDGDIFGAVTRLGRNAAEALIGALHGAECDSFHAAHCIDVLIAKAEGVSSLPAVLATLQSLRDTPLLAPTMVEGAAERIADAVRDARGTVLDLMLRSAAERCLFRGEYEPRTVLQEFCLTLLDRAIISCRGGFLELASRDRARVGEAMARLGPLAARAAELLETRPNAKRLGLSREYARLTPDTGLLGGRP